MDEKQGGLVRLARLVKARKDLKELSRLAMGDAEHGRMTGTREGHLSARYNWGRAYAIDKAWVRLRTAETMSDAFIARGWVQRRAEQVANGASALPPSPGDSDRGVGHSDDGRDVEGERATLAGKEDGFNEALRTIERFLNHAVEDEISDHLAGAETNTPAVRAFDDAGRCVSAHPERQPRSRTR